MALAFWFWWAHHINPQALFLVHPHKILLERDAFNGMTVEEWFAAGCPEIKRP